MTENILERKVKTYLPTEYGDYTIYGYEEPNGKEHIALVKGNIEEAKEAGVLCRVHSECLTGEVFGSLKCDCKEQLEIAFNKIDEEGAGIIVYLRQEGRGIGLIEKLKAYQLQHQGKDTVEANLDLGHQADQRDYNIAAAILKDLGVEKIQMLTNNPDKIAQLESYGITVLARKSVIPSRLSEHNTGYLRTKVEKMQHIIEKLK